MRLGAGNDSARGAGGKDRILGGRGDDRLSGGAGADRLKGGAGKDRLNGGKGKDRLSGGAGADRLDAADGRADKVVDGGGGKNICKIDAAELSIVRRCAKLTVVGGAGTPGGGSTTEPPTGALDLATAEGLSCASSLPLCTSALTGNGADSPVGAVTGGGGVTPGAGLGVSLSEDDWEARGLYGCTAGGYLRVAIGEKSVDAPGDCTA